MMLTVTVIYKESFAKVYINNSVFLTEIKMPSWNVNDNLPTLEAGKKVAIVYTADKESNLLAKLAIQKYGSDNVYLLSQTVRGKQEYEQNIISKIQAGVQLVSGTHNIHITRDDLDDRDGSYARLFPTFYRKIASYLNKPIQELASIIQFILFDRNKTEIDLLSVDLSSVTNVEAFRAQIAAQDLSHILDEVSNARLQYALDYQLESPDLSILTSMSDTMVIPFRELTAVDVINLYNQLGETDLLWSTVSCNNFEVEGHCGACPSCQDRRIQIDRSEVEDLTVYTI